MSDVVVVTEEFDPNSYTHRALTEWHERNAVAIAEARKQAQEIKGLIEEISALADQTTCLECGVVMLHVNGTPPTRCLNCKVIL